MKANSQAQISEIERQIDAEKEKRWKIKRIFTKDSSDGKEKEQIEEKSI